MRKDFILTPEEKLSKQKRLEENRRMSSKQVSSNATDIKTEESPDVSINCEPVREKNVYEIHKKLIKCYI